jgi:hypothetical protein
MDNNIVGNNMGGNKSKGSKKSGQVIGIIVLVVLVVLAVVFAAYFWKGQKPVIVPVVKTVATSTSPFLQKAEPGQIVIGFPKELIVDKKATKISSAENVSKDPKSQFLVTTYRSTESIDALEKAYVSFFKTNKWTVLADKKGTASLNMGAFLTGFGNTSINIFKDNKSQDNFVIVLFYKTK